MRERLNGTAIKGRVRLYHVFDNVKPHWHRVTDWVHNEIMYDWATIVGTLLSDIALVMMDPRIRMET